MNLPVREPAVGQRLAIVAFGPMNAVGTGGNCQRVAAIVGAVPHDEPSVDLQNMHPGSLNAVDGIFRPDV